MKITIFFIWNERMIRIENANKIPQASLEVWRPNFVGQKSQLK